MTSRNLTSIVLVFGLVVLFVSAVVSAETLVEKESSYASKPLSEIAQGPQSMQGASSSIFSLFDPSRFSMHQSYSIAFMSGSTGSQSIAMYLNSIDYKLAQPLTLQVDLAFMHQPQTLFGAEGSSGLNGKILPSFRLLWEPSKDFHMSISYESRSAYYNPYYNSYYDPFYRGYGSRSLFGR